MAATVLVVEDEARLRDLIRSFLESEGFVVMTTGSGAEAISMAAKSPPDLVVLDLGLPDVPGLEVSKELRRNSDVPLLMVTAKVSAEDRIRGLELGADDYLTKPFSPRELVLRVRAILRRGRAAVAPPTTSSFGAGMLVVDEERHELYCNGELVPVSLTEWRILQVLTRAPGRVYSRYELVNAVRGQDWEGYERVIDSHVKNLRRKLGEASCSPRVIETVLGVGYRLALKRDR